MNVNLIYLVETYTEIKKSTLNFQPKLLNIFRTACTSPIPTNGTYLELSGQDHYVPTHIGLICGYY